jgi:hypothetical protein
MGLSDIQRYTPPLHTADDPAVTELIADGGETAVDVGEVQVWNDGDYLYVKYIVDADLTPGDASDDGVPTLIYQTHLAVESDLESIPQTKKGNPIPGQFEYSTIHDPGVSEFTYQIPLEWDPDTELYIAAHAVVKKLGGLTGLELALPDNVTMKVAYPYSGGPAYFPTTTISGGTTVYGTYYGWCVDTDRTIGNNTDYTANVYSSYESLPTGLVEYPENLDLVNWILNQNYVGQTSPGGYGTYTYGDVQRAIWTLVEDQNSTAGLGPWNQNRVNEILAAAQANGEGFEPGCGEVVAVILVPVTDDGAPQQIIIAQVTLIQVGVPCEEITETAWGGGTTFGGKQWGTYFTCTVQEPGPTVPPGEPDKLKGFGIRYRSFGNTGADEIYLGRGDLGVAGNRAQRNFGYMPWGADNGITFTYDAVNDKLTTAVDIGNDDSDDFTLEYLNLADQVAALDNGCTVGEVDFMILSVVGRDASTTVDFHNVTLDSYALGNYSGTGGWFNWTVTGFDFTGGFTVTGDLMLSGTFGTSQELSKLEMLVGCSP